MKRIENISEAEREKLLQCLYKEEIFQTFTIHSLQHNWFQVCYINKDNEQITSMLIVTDEGNCFYTTFWVRNKKELHIIAKQLQALKDNRILLAGKRAEVQEIMQYLRIEEEASTDFCYVYDKGNVTETDGNQIRKAMINEEDICYIQQFYKSFFQPSTEAELEKIRNRRKIESDIQKGLYFVMEGDEPVGMGRYGSVTKHYVELTTMYVKARFRGKGYGKTLLNGLIHSCLTAGKQPILQTSYDNREARGLYEKIGFTQIGEYSFQFMRR
ncbi:hypothetical protein BAMA_08150 [Bacillus manliponensis]|uniref:N-acetyltransferase domain-containing protein n=1 Tax=Bacillus manliponensis TaxID=574376 RepID=A0A073JUN0_9BACI|nr:GNAT family N-acetyltransferase [Bacillus manliponensis]KEK17990.1 hypothetical protein BAMA_08150 [Bacillus manliponensis]